MGWIALQNSAKSLHSFYTTIEINGIYMNCSSKWECCSMKMQQRQQGSAVILKGEEQVRELKYTTDGNTNRNEGYRGYVVESQTS